MISLVRVEQQRRITKGAKMARPKDGDRDEANRVMRELRASAKRLIARSRELAEEAERLNQRADDLAQLIKQRALIKQRESRKP
jgi:hypothetical protein